MGLFDIFKKKKVVDVEKAYGESSVTLPVFYQGGNIRGDQSYEQIVIQAFQSNELCYCALMKLATSAASVKPLLYDNEGERVDGSLLEELMNKPGLGLGYDHLMQTTVLHLYLSGNAYWLKLRNNSGEVVGLQIIEPRFMSYKSVDGYTVDKYLFKGSKDSELDPADVLHFRMPDPTDPIVGQSPLAAAMGQITADNEASSMTKWLLINKAIPGFSLSAPGPLGPEVRARMKTEIAEGFAGKNRGKVMILENGLEASSIALSPNDMALMDMRRIIETRILAAIGVPPILIGSFTGLEHATMANVEESRKIFWEDTLAPLLCKLECVLESDPDLNPEGLDVKFDLHDTPAYINKQAQMETMALNGYDMGVMTLNEVRQVMGLGALPDGDKVKQVAMPSFGGFDAPSDEPELKASVAANKSARDLRNLESITGRNEIADKYYRDLYDATAYLNTKHMSQVVRIFEKMSQEEDKEEITKARDVELRDPVTIQLQALRAAWIDDATNLYAGPLYALSKETAKAVYKIEYNSPVTLPNDRLLAETAKYAAKIAEKSVESRISQALNIMQAGFAQGDSLRAIAKTLQAEIPSMSKVSADRIARTETIRAVNNTAREVYRAEGVKYQMWRASSDACEECGALDGQVIGIDDEYKYSGNMSLDYTDGALNGPPLHPNCRCAIEKVDG